MSAKYDSLSYCDIYRVMCLRHQFDNGNIEFITANLASASNRKNCKEDLDGSAKYYRHKVTVFLLKIWSQNQLCFAQLLEANFNTPYLCMSSTPVDTYTRNSHW